MRAFRNSTLLSLAAAAHPGDRSDSARHRHGAPRRARRGAGCRAHSSCPMRCRASCSPSPASCSSCRPLPLIGSLYATAWIILVAYLMRFATLRLPDRSPSPCGRSRANWTKRQPPPAQAPSGACRTITAPLAAPAAVAGALLVFMSAFNELTVSALLWSGGNETLGVVLFSLEEAGLAAHAAAVAVTTILAVILYPRRARPLLGAACLPACCPGAESN